MDKKLLLNNEELICSFNQMEREEIKKISVKWACGINKRFLTKSAPRSANGYRVFYIDLNQLIHLGNFGEMDGVELAPHHLFTGGEKRDYRVAKVLYHWSNDGYIDPPEIYPSNRSQKISFTDGRHRTIAAFHIGEKQIPVLIHKSFIQEMSRIITLTILRV